MRTNSIFTISEHQLGALPMALSETEHSAQTLTHHPAESTYNGAGEERLKKEKVSPLATSSILNDLGDQVAMSSQPRTQHTATSTESLTLVKEAVSCDTDSPMPMTTRSRSGVQMKQRKRSPYFTTENGSPVKLSQSHRVLKRKSPNGRRYHIKPEQLSPPRMGSLIPATQDEAVDSTVGDSNAKIVKLQAIKRTKDAVLERHDSDSSIECTGEAELDIEEGASNLWSILQKVDDNESDEELQTHLHKTPLKKTRKDFFSTVLNSPIEPTSSSPESGPLTLTPASSPPKPNPNETDDGEYQDSDTTKTPSHRRKSTHRRSPKPKNPTTPPTRICKTTGKPFNHSITVRSTPRKRAPPLSEFVSDQIPIPTSWDAVSEADKKLMSMKEDGKGWDTIRKTWKEMTGQDAAPSTLPNRYNRIKANLMILTPRETSMLLQSVKEVDKIQRAEKWTRVSAVMHTRSGTKHTAEYLQKQFSAIG